jgi:hypothetical protein
LCLDGLHRTLTHRQGAGISVIDPHGSLVDDLLSSIHRACTNDVIYLNPASTRVPGINVLESVSETDRPLVVSSVVSIMRKLWPDSWVRRSEWILEHPLYAPRMREMAVPLQ